MLDESPFRSKNGFLPLLRTGDKLLAGYEEIIEFFRENVR